MRVIPVVPGILVFPVVLVVAVVPAPFLSLIYSCFLLSFILHLCNVLIFKCWIFFSADAFWSQFLL